MLEDPQAHRRLSFMAGTQSTPRILTTTMSLGQQSLFGPAPLTGTRLACKTISEVDQ